MKTRVLWGLVAINAVLATALVYRWTPANQAMAGSNRPSDYLAIPAQVATSTNGIVYVLDQSNRQLGAMSYDLNNHRLSVWPKFDLDPIFDDVRSGMPGPRPGGQ